MKISKSSVIQRASELKLLVSRNRIFIEPQAGEKIASNYHALALLDIFARPRTLQDALESAGKRLTGRWDWINLTAEIKRLIRIGALVVDGQAPQKLEFSNARFDSSEIHIRMLQDSTRTLAYQEAIKASVSPSDVVVDVGTGTGVLAATAAQNGAKTVYAIERSSNMAKLARQFFDENGLSDKIQLIEGMSSQIDIPTPGDVLITETIGNDPLREGILEICHDAISRGLVRPEATFIPNKLALYAIGLQMPERLIGKLRFSTKNCNDWKTRYGLDFAVFRNASMEAEGAINLGSQETRTWKRFSNPINLAEFKLGKDAARNVDFTFEIECQQDGNLNCILLYFDASLDNHTQLSTHPDQATQHNSWANLVWILKGEGLNVSLGEKVEVTYIYDSIVRRSSFNAKKTPA